MRIRRYCLPLLICIGIASWLPAEGADPKSRFIDLSLLVAPGYPCTRADGFPRFRMHPYLRIGRSSAYNSEILTIDGNTGTQMDVPPHSVARPSLKLPHSGAYGEQFTELVPPWKFVGEACVVDVRSLLNKAPKGRSSLVRRTHLAAWEKQHRPFRFGDAVLLRSDYSDRYYKPLPAGRGFIADVLENKKSGWPDPDPDAMDFLAGTRGVRHIGTDSPSMGPVPDLAEPTHYAALKHGAIFTEGATGLGQLPTTGAFYCMMGPKHKGGPYGEGRAFAIVGPLASRLIASARARRVVDLSVVNSIDLPLTWPGVGVDRHRHRYTKADFLFSDNLKLYHHTHIMDSHAGTHLVPPAYALPPARFNPAGYAPQVRVWLEEYQREFGPRGESDVTTEKVPLGQTAGPVRRIDVRHLIGSTRRTDWPASPEITVATITRYETDHGPLRPGQVVLFQTGHTDKYLRPGTEGAACLTEPINGKREGWPAPGPAAIHYLAKRGIRCVGIDAPSLGGVEPGRALKTYWALGGKGIAGVEFLTRLQELPAKAYFLFAAVKIRGCHGGPGRAIALY